MADLEKEKHLDELLDSLLATYSDVQPRPGLQTRVLTNLRLNSPKKNSYAWLWTIITVGGLALAVIAIYFSKVTPLPESPRIQRAESPAVAPNPVIGPHI